jgi:hypothetical protein
VTDGFLHELGGSERDAGFHGSFGKFESWVGHVFGDVEYWGWYYDAVSVEVISRELFFFAVVDLEVPVGGTVTATFGTVDLEDVVSSSEGYLEVQLGGSSSLPNIRVILFDDLAINVNDTSTTEIGGDKEFIGGLLVDWEDDFVVETNVSVGSSTLTEPPVAEAHQGCTCS